MSTILRPILSFTGLVSCAIFFGMNERALFPMVVFAEFTDVDTERERDEDDRSNVFNRLGKEYNGVEIALSSALGKDK